MYITFGKRSVSVILSLLAVLLAFLTFEVAVAKGKTREKVDTDTARYRFLSGMGLNVDMQSEKIKTVTIPNNFGDVYTNYNEIQKQAGYDLSKYRGESVTLYTYEVLNPQSDCLCVNLLVYKGKPIGGDICSVAMNGFIEPLCADTVEKIRRDTNVDDKT